MVLFVQTDHWFSRSPQMTVVLTVLPGDHWSSLSPPQVTVGLCSSTSCDHWSSQTLQVTVVLAVPSGDHWSLQSPPKVRAVTLLSSEPHLGELG